MFFTQPVVPHLSPGSIVFISASLTSISTVKPQFSLYCTSRGAAEQMVILAKDLGRKGITVNSMNPEPTHTDAFHDGKTGEQVKAIACPRTLRA